MRLERHEEFELNCQSLAEGLSELSPAGPADFDETMAFCLEDMVESAEQIHNHLQSLRRSFNAESLRESCEKLAGLYNPPPEGAPPVERRKWVAYTITPKAANISQNVDRLAGEFEVVRERLRAGAEIARGHFRFDEDGELVAITLPAERELREVREAFDDAHERIARMMGEFKAFGFFDHVAHVRRQVLCDECRSAGASIEDDFSNELFLPE